MGDEEWLERINDKPDFYGGYCRNEPEDRVKHFFNDRAAGW
jgi:hypothetical protein